ncbi:hypothetical protein PCE1_001476 [Barthelona sp. PCE]
MGLFSRLMDWLRSLFWNSEMEIALVGLAAAGKTTFVNVLSGNEFSEARKATLGVNVQRFQQGACSVRAWDVGGQQRFVSSWERYCRGCDVIVFMIDGSNPSTHMNAKEELFNLVNRPTLLSIPVLILANKCDLPGHVSEAQLSNILELKELKGDRDIAIYDISCKNSHNLDVVMRWLNRFSR